MKTLENTENQYFYEKNYTQMIFVLQYSLHL
jgi:hypothetical protein